MSIMRISNELRTPRFGFFLCSHGMPTVASSAVSDAHVDRFDPTHLVVTWTDSEAVDVYLSDLPEGDVSKAKVLSTDNHDGRYMAVLRVNAGRPYFLLRNSAGGNFVRVSERVLPLERGSNFRDVGGNAAGAGKHVRWGFDLSFRSNAVALRQ